MEPTPENKASADTYILAGRDTTDGSWQAIETAAVEDGETVDDVKAFLQTMGHASSRNFVELEIMTAAEFARRGGPEKPTIAA